MAVEYFTPKENTLYSINFQSSGWWETYTSEEGDDFLRARQIEDPATRYPDGSIDDHHDSLWQFFKVAENSYALANYKYGNMWKIFKGTEYNCIRTGDLQDETPLFSLIYDESKQYIQLVVSTTDVYGIIDADLSRGNDEDYIRVQAATDFSFKIMEINSNPAKDSLAVLNLMQEIDEPTFINGTAPQSYPSEPMLMNEVYVPYFIVNDKTLASMGDRIQQTPYYILRQYGQYGIIAEYKNGSAGTVTFVETWEYGWSATVSLKVSAQLGFDLGIKLEENEIILKEMEEVNIKVDFGIELGASVSGHGTYSKQIRAEAPPNNTIAIYGTNAFFELYQGDGTSAIASPNMPMKMNRRYVSISQPYPNTEDE